jgi:signal transduction histidine kinase
VLAAEDQFLEVIGSSGHPQELLAEWLRVPLAGNTPLAEAARTKATVLIDSRAALAARDPQIAASPLIDRFAAWAAIPLLVDGRASGAIGLSFSRPRTFGEEERVFLLTLASQCAQALERTRLYESEQQARARAEVAVRLRDQFLSIAAHELKTPLTSLLGYAQLFQRRAARAGSLGEADQRALGVIVDQAARLNRMVTALLDISRIESGQLSITRAPLDLCVLARQVIEQARSQADDHPLELACLHEPLIVEGDDLRLEQVLQNLVQNAVKYSPDGTPITVRIARQGAQACIAVTDRGIGIPTQAIPRLFQRFYRAPNVDELRISGMGIGLYVVREIVMLHGGTVEVESEEGAGSTFTVCLPLAPIDSSRAEV